MNSYRRGVRGKKRKELKRRRNKSKELVERRISV